jgi:hypothetical protein
VGLTQRSNGRQTAKHETLFYSAQVAQPNPLRQATKGHNGPVSSKADHYRISLVHTTLVRLPVARKAYALHCFFATKPKAGDVVPSSDACHKIPLKSRYGSGKCEGVRIIYTTRLKSCALVLLSIDANSAKELILHTS